MPRLTVERRRFGAHHEIPALVLQPQERPEAPVVLFQHGYTGRKENALGNLLELAERGYQVVLLDARLHGERRPDDFALADALRPLYDAAPERLEFHLDPALGHTVTEPMWQAGFAWMRRFLPPAG